MIIWRGREESHSIGYSFPPRNSLQTFVLSPLPETLIYFCLSLSAHHHFLFPSQFSPCYILYLFISLFIMQDDLLNILGYLKIDCFGFYPQLFSLGFSQEQKWVSPWDRVLMNRLFSFLHKQMCIYTDTVFEMCIFRNLA